MSTTANGGFLVENADRLTISFVDNTGGGSSTSVDVAPGTTLKDFFFMRLGSSANPANYLILVNGASQRADYALSANDRVSLSPVGVKGASDGGFLSETSNRLTISFVDNTGGGSSTSVDVAPGTTLKDFFFMRLGASANPANYLILVNGASQRADYALAANDRVSLSPVGVKGA